MQAACDGGGRDVKGTRWGSLALATALWACDGEDDPTGLVDTPCTDDTGSVSVTISSGLQPAFDWDPDCAVALVLVEEEASDAWGITTDVSTWDDPAQANLIEPPVQYGVAPASVTEFEPPAPLTAGVTYEVILWRVAPGSTDDCAAVFSPGACLLAVQEFTP
jgi:hypothetical protein